VTTTLRITTALDADELKRENTTKEIKEFILELDLAVADAGFTQDLIIHLAESLKGDATTANMASIGNHIAKMEGEHCTSTQTVNYTT